jgi:transposase-like protein
MRRHYKVKYKLWAIKCWRNNNMNLRGTAKRLGLHKSTLQKWIKNAIPLSHSNNPEFREHVQRE